MPQVLGWIYFCILAGISGGAPLSKYPLALVSISGILVFFISLISIAAFGHLLNDWCDIKSDAKAGKPNLMAKLNLTMRILVTSIPFLCGIAGWILLNHLLSRQWEIPMKTANALFAAQLLALVLYSAEPFRLKERAELGAILDAFYGHLNPVMITLATFGLYPLSGYWYYSVIALVSVLCFTKGIRNILLHQIEDRKKDDSAKINSVVLKYGTWRVINFVNDLLFPAEVFFLICLTLVMSIHIPPCIIPLIFFGVLSYLKLNGWKLGYADRRLLEFKFTYFMNDYYEGWLPVFLLIIISVYRHEFIFLLILHLILFPMFAINLVRDVKTIKQNFKTEEDY